jgi:hypothetical protein
MAKEDRRSDDRNGEVREMRNAETILGIIRERKSATRRFIVNDLQGASLRHRSLESRLEIERLTSGSEGGCWKSALMSNSLAAYPTLTHGSEAEWRRRLRRLG